ncbi:MAG: hypothetical protein KGV59_05105 [Tenacibaculum sp.]|nr:hypothetical protein [Tenacibaculum sp.]
MWKKTAKSPTTGKELISEILGVFALEPNGEPVLEIIEENNKKIAIYKITDYLEKDKKRRKSHYKKELLGRDGFIKEDLDKWLIDSIFLVTDYQQMFHDFIGVLSVKEEGIKILDKIKLGQDDELWYGERGMKSMKRKIKSKFILTNGKLYKELYKLDNKVGGKIPRIK